VTEAALFLDSHRRHLAKSWLRTAGAACAFTALFVLAARFTDFHPIDLFFGRERFGDYLGHLVPPLRLANPAASLRSWFWNGRQWLALLGDTILMAYLGTLLGAVLGLVLAAVAARNLDAPRWVRFLSKRLLEVSRTVPAMVFALILLVAFGAGPLAAVFALAAHSLGSLGKLFTEAIEDVPAPALESLRSTGAGFIPVFRFGALPAILPALLSYSLLRFEINVRSSSVLGFVGVGGIGQELYFAVRQYQYADISAILTLLIATVMLIDWGCGSLRRRLNG
jgi:phosphonate transport system permease protein